MLLHSHISVERGKLTAGDVVITESGILKLEEERIITVSVPSLVSLYILYIDVERFFEQCC